MRALAGSAVKLTREEIIDLIVAAATPAVCRFMGDDRDGDAPPIALDNFSIEAQRYGAQALRARLSGLSRAELDAELASAAAYRATIPTRDEIERLVRENNAAELSKRQAERAQRPRLQPAILAAARHYRAQKKMNHKEAWRAIGANPYTAGDYGTVVIDDQKMCVRSRGGTQARLGITIDQWRQRYWTAAGKPG
jgi:hypothetical protein